MLSFIFSSISIKDCIELILRVEPRFVVLFFLSSFMMSLFSAWRYNLLLACAGYRVPAVSMYLVVLVRNLGSDLLPARLGTLVYVWLSKTRLGIPLHAAVSSFSVAMLLDIMAMCPLFLIAALFATGIAEVSPIVIAAAAVILLLLLLLFSYFGIRFLDFAIKKLQGRLKQEWLEAIQKVRLDLNHILSSKLLPQILLLSLSVRIFKYLGLYLFLLALLVPQGFSSQELPFSKMFIGMSLAELSSSLPISGIAGLGAYQGAWIAAFSFLGFSLEMAKTTSVSHHLFTQLYGYSLGLLALLILLLPYFYRNEAMKAQTQKYFTIKFATILACYILVAVFIWPQKAKTEEVHTTSHKAEIEVTRLIPEGSEIIFDSNFTGTFGIYALSKGSDKIKKIVDQADRHEMFPDASPSGAKIVFADAKGAGRHALSDVAIFDRKSAEIKVVAKNGIFPSFKSETSIIFERNRKQVVELNLSNLEEKQIFPAAMAKSWGDYQVVKPRISPSGRFLTFTSDKGSRWSLWLVDLVKLEFKILLKGCQASFLNDDTLIYIDEVNSKAGSGINLIKIDGSSKQTLFDEEGESGHEYFPFFNGADLLFSASSQDSHSHEDGNYNLFYRPQNTDKKLALIKGLKTSRWPKLVKVAPQVS
jgi:uncharacterized protein (TIRG00374 family)